MALKLPLGKFQERSTVIVEGVIKAGLIAHTTPDVHHPDLGSSAFSDFRV